MPDLVTITTDFGAGSSYVAAMKGALLSVALDVRFVDLSHDIPPQDLSAAALFLEKSLPWFPPGLVHVVVVDPGVGTARPLLIAAWNGSFIVAPDNGCWTLAASKPDIVWRLDRPEVWHPVVAPTFHGRDIIAPIAGRLCRGTAPDLLGSRVHQWVRYSLPEPACQADRIYGEVIEVDSFGNLITNIGRELVDVRRQGSPLLVVAAVRVDHWVSTYGEGRPGELVGLVSSNGRIEVALVNGSAATRLGVGRGTAVEIRFGLVS